MRLINHCELYPVTILSSLQLWQSTWLKSSIVIWTASWSPPWSERHPDHHWLLQASTASRLCTTWQISQAWLAETKCRSPYLWHIVCITMATTNYCFPSLILTLILEIKFFVYQEMSCLASEWTWILKKKIFSFSFFPPTSGPTFCSQKSVKQEINLVWPKQGVRVHLYVSSSVEINSWKSSKDITSTINTKFKLLIPK